MFKNPFDNGDIIRIVTNAVCFTLIACAFGVSFYFGIKLGMYAFWN